MNLSVVKYCSLAFVSALALSLGCGGGDSSDSGGGIVTPPKNIPTVTNPAIKYNFFELDKKTEKDLREETNYGYAIAKVRPKFRVSFFEDLGFEVLDSMAADGAVYHRLRKTSMSDVLPALNKAKKHAALFYIEPEVKRKLLAVETSPVIYNNPDLYVANKGLYSVYTTKAYDAWLKYGFSPVNKPIVASVDSGVRWNHQDLLGQVKHAYSWFAPNNNGSEWLFESHFSLAGGSIPLDGERMMSLLPDMTKPYNGTMYYGTDTEAHGTHTSGTICAIGNNGVGGAGICWNAELIQYKCFPSDGEGSIWSLYGSIWHLARWKEANDYKATIPVNFSIGGPYTTQFEIDMIAHGLRHGIILVAAAGNAGHDEVHYPAALTGVIAVGASTGADNLVSFSSYGPHVSVVAPGENILSTVIANATNNVATSANTTSYTWYGGTSMAAPHVTGLIGYMLNFNPELKPDQIKTLIEQNADYIAARHGQAVQTGFSEETGWGRINVLKTIEAVIDGVNNGTAPPSSYSINPVKITSPVNNINIYLYNCSADGAIQNYAGTSIVGEYLAGLDMETFEGREDKVAYFSLLRPGWYVAKAFVAGKVSTTEPFQVTAGMETKTVPLIFEAEILTLQTFATPAWEDGIYADTMIGFYDSEGVEIDWIDWFIFDDLIVLMPDEPGDYYIHISDYDGDEYQGEYALYATKGNLWRPDNDSDWADFDDEKLTPVAPGTFTNPIGGVKGAQATTPADAMPISLNTIYYGFFNGPGGGTSGETGHWYKITVTPMEE